MDSLRDRKQSAEIRSNKEEILTNRRLNHEQVIIDDRVRLQVSPKEAIAILSIIVAIALSWASIKIDIASVKSAIDNHMTIQDMTESNQTKIDNAQNQRISDLDRMLSNNNADSSGTLK